MIQLNLVCLIPLLVLTWFVQVTQLSNFLSLQGFGTRLMMLIIGREVKFLSFRVFKPQLPVFRTEPHVHQKLQRTFQRDNERWLWRGWWWYSRLMTHIGLYMHIHVRIHKYMTGVIGITDSHFMALDSLTFWSNISFVIFFSNNKISTVQ